MVDLYKDPRGEGIFGKTTDDKFASGVFNEPKSTLSNVIISSQTQ